MLTSRFEEAMIYAFRTHIHQKRKGTEIPYISHLLSVTALVMESGGTEDQIIAALLHDAPEDQGGLETLADIREKFGLSVADIVEGCTDTFDEPKPEWWERKRKYLAHLPQAAKSTLLVSVADKLHNARCILGDYRAVDEELWSRFNAGKEGTLWYYRELVNTYKKIPNAPEKLVAELERVVSELEKLSDKTAKHGSTRDELIKK